MVDDECRGTIKLQRTLKGPKIIFLEIDKNLAYQKVPHHLLANFELTSPRPQGVPWAPKIGLPNFLQFSFDIKKSAKKNAFFMILELGAPLLMMFNDGWRMATDGRTDNLFNFNLILFNCS